MFTLQRILAPVDFSEGSEKALDLAIDLAKTFNASLDVVHVFEEPTFPSFYGAGALMMYGHVPDMRKEAEKAFAKMSESLASRHSQVQTHFIDGHAADSIVSFAKENKTDLIVIATHGLTGLKHVLMGSIAERVVREAPCAVYVARQ